MEAVRTKYHMAPVKWAPLGGGAKLKIMHTGVVAARHEATPPIRIPDNNVGHLHFSLSLLADTG